MASPDRAKPEAAAAGLDAREWTALTLVTLLATVVRVWRFDELGLIHFDEGAYALSSLSLPTGQFPAALYPTQYVMSPPLFFLLAGGLMTLLGTTSALVAIAVSTVLGIATVPLLYLIGREWHGPRAGLVASILLALSNYHILYSRMAMTDIAFTFFFLLALWAYTRMARRPGVAMALCAGVAVGLAWNTKFHGWLAGVICFLALAAWWWRHRTPAWRCLLPFSISVAAAIVLYLPWSLYTLSIPGGHGEVVRAHMDFLYGLSAFPHHALSHIKTQFFLDGWMGRLAPALGLLAAVLVAGNGRARTARLLIWVPLLVAGGMWAGEVFLAGVVALAGVWATFRSPTFGSRMSVIFFAMFLVLTPIYIPYSRLLLPFVCATFVLAGAGLQSITRAGTLVPRSTAGLARAAAVAWLVLLVAVFTFDGKVRDTSDVYLPSNGFEMAAEELVHLVGPQARVLVIGEPALVYYLQAGHDMAAEHRDLPELAQETGTVHVVSGIYSRRTGLFDGWREENPGAARLLEVIPVEVNDVRLLDDFRTHKARALRWDGNPHSIGDHDLEVFEVSLADAVDAAPQDR